MPKATEKIALTVKQESSRITREAVIKEREDEDARPWGFDTEAAIGPELPYNHARVYDPIQNE